MWHLKCHFHSFLNLHSDSHGFIFIGQCILVKFFIKLLNLFEHRASEPWNFPTRRELAL